MEQNTPGDCSHAWRATSNCSPYPELYSYALWNGAIQNYWNEITQTASQAHNLGTAENARLFALFNLCLADSVIALYDAKYVYNFWRPVTAIRAAATDNNPETLADQGWLPEVGKTAPDPSYPKCCVCSSVETISTLT